MANEDAANGAISASDLLKKIWQGYVPPQYDDMPALKQWDAKTRASFIVRDILTKQGVDTSGLRFKDDGSLEDANKKTWLDHIVDVSPYVIGAVAGAGALGAFGGGGSVTNAGMTATATDIGGDMIPAVLPAVTTVAPVAAASGAGVAAVPTTVSSLAAAGGTGSTLSTVMKAADLARGVGKSISDASSAAGNTRRADFDTNVLGEAAHQRALNDLQDSNTRGQSAFETELLNRSHDEQVQRKSALQDSYRGSYVSTPHAGPFNPRPVTYSPEYQATVAALAGQGNERLKTPAQYATPNQPALKPFTPRDPASVPNYTPTDPSTLEKVGNWVGPGLSTAGTVLNYWDKISKWL